MTTGHPSGLRAWARSAYEGVLLWQRRHPRVVVGVFVVVGVVLGVWLGWEAVQGVSWRATLAALGGFSALHGIGAVACFLANNFLRSTAWYILFPQRAPPVWRLFLVENTGIGVNNLLPMRWFSEAVQFAILRVRDQVPEGIALATLGMTRVLDFQANFLLLAVSMPLVPGVREHVAMGPVLGVAFFLAAGSTLGLHGLGWAYRRFPRFRRLPVVAGVGEAVLALEERPRRLVVALVLTLGQWTALGGAAWFLAQGVDIDISLAGAVALVILVTFSATTIPGLLGGLGVFEFASVGLLVTFFGVEKSVALSCGLLMHALWWLPPVLIALVMLPLEGWGALQMVRRGPLPGTHNAPP
ncbi:MAG: flippase-like domain-containing protein [Dehalococcoidia bacterium]|nr:flippase-like domain-containing protein [Dehalococcoidia bacterium]MDW8119474.1 lysylphosphatidylglycerol synthase transmembrane domain-containing protein [Chloroflexota bacterium]